MPTPDTTPGARGAPVVDVAPRRAGKTTRALAWVAATPDRRMLVVATVADHDLARAIARATWPEVRWRPANILTAGQARALLVNHFLDDDVETWVDDVDQVARQLLHAHRLAGVSLTDPDDLTREPALEAP